MKLTDEQRKFAHDNVGLINAFMNMKHIDYDHEADFYGLLSSEYCKAVATYDSAKGNFSTYAYTFFDNAMRKYYQHSQYNVRRVHSEQMYSLNNTNGDDEVDTWQDLIVDKKVDIETESINMALVNDIFDVVTETQKKYLMLFYQGLAKIDISKELGVSAQLVDETFKSVRKTLGRHGITWEGQEDMDKSDSVMGIRNQMLSNIKKYIKEHGYPPSYREIGDMVNLSSVASVQHHMSILFKEGLLETDAPVGTPRAFRVAKKRHG